MKFNPLSGNGTQDDLAASVTATIVKWIDTAREKAVEPILFVVRAVVYGLLGAIVGTATLVMLAIVFVRLLDIYLDNIPGVPENVWFAHLIVGALFFIVGLVLWAQRHARESA